MLEVMEGSAFVPTTLHSNTSLLLYFLKLKMDLCIEINLAVKSIHENHEKVRVL